MEILLIEDSLTYARMTMRALENSGLPHRLTWLARGDEALAALRRRGRYAELERPDLILLDLTLPGIDGRDVLATIRDDADLARIPVIVLTASNDAEDRNVSMLQGVRKYLTKPVRPSELLDVVCRLKSAEAEVV